MTIDLSQRRKENLGDWTTGLEIPVVLKNCWNEDKRTHGERSELLAGYKVLKVKVLVVSTV